MSKLVVAITGGIGSGKSQVCAMLKDMGYKVFSADEVYNDLIKKSNLPKLIYKALNLEYNEEVGFNRKEISNKVFNDKNSLNILNEISHKKVMEELFKLNDSENGIVFNEVPLLFESNLQSLYSEIFIVVRPISDRITAVEKRSNLSEEEIRKIMANQVNYENISLNEHTLIINDGDLVVLKERVEKAVDKIKNKI